MGCWKSLVLDRWEIENVNVDRVFWVGKDFIMLTKNLYYKCENRAEKLIYQITVIAESNVSK